MAAPRAAADGLAVADDADRLGEAVGVAVGRHEAAERGCEETLRSKTADRVPASAAAGAGPGCGWQAAKCGACEQDSRAAAAGARHPRHLHLSCLHLRVPRTRSRPCRAARVRRHEQTSARTCCIRTASRLYAASSGA